MKLNLLPKNKEIRLIVLGVFGSNIQSNILRSGDRIVFHVDGSITTMNLRKWLSNPLTIAESDYASIEVGLDVSYYTKQVQKYEEWITMLKKDCEEYSLLFNTDNLKS